MSIPPAPAGTVILRPRDLWLTPTEAADLVRSRFPMITEAELERARRIGEGWASAVLAAALAVVGGATEESVAGPEIDRRTLDDVAAPYVEALPVQERGTLLAVAGPDVLDRDDVLALTGAPAAIDLLRSAAEAGGLVTTIGGFDVWRLHPVLRRYLRLQTAVGGVEHSAGVAAHRRALQHFGARGDRVRAVRHAVAGGDPDTIVDALVEHGPSLVADIHEDVFDDALAALPDDVTENEPALLAVRALRHRTSGSVTAGLRDAARLAELDRAAGRPTGHSVRLAADRLLVELFEARFGLVEAAGAVAAAAALLDGEDPPHLAELCPARRAWLSFELGAASLWLGDVSRAALWTERGMTVAQFSGSPRLVAGALAHRSVLEVADTAFAAAGESARRCLATAVAGRLLTDAYVARAHVAAAWASYARLDPDAAWDHLAAVEATPPDELDPTVLTLAQVVRGRLLTVEGDLESAWQLLSGRSVDRADLPAPFARLLAVARAEVAVDRRDVTALLRESQTLDTLGCPEDATLFRGVAAMFSGDLPQAREALQDLLGHPTTVPTTGAAAAACLLALALRVEGADAARPLVPDLLSRVATCAADVVLRIPARTGEAFPELLEAEVHRPDGHPYAAEALDRLRRYESRRSLPRSPDGAHGDDPVPSPLTSRESAVLACLRDGLSYDDIGRALFITPNTVKTHVRSLYRKLGVQRSGQAVRVARELGLLSAGG
jgi:LuxR family maltose regulon positive regulatory protein